MRFAVLPRAGLAALALCACVGGIDAAPLSTDEIAKLCAEAEGPAHCGRLVEATQLKRLPNLARRDGASLFVRLYPSGEARLEDRETLSGGTTYSLFDFLNELNSVVLWTTQDDTLGFLLIERRTGRQTPLPAQPVPSPERNHFATADFCASRCENQLVVWVADRDGVRRELSWKPAEKWADASVQWKDTDMLVVEYTPEGDAAPKRLERRLSDPSWTRVGSR